MSTIKSALTTIINNKRIDYFSFMRECQEFSSKSHSPEDFLRQISSFGTWLTNFISSKSDWMLACQCSRSRRWRNSNTDEGEEVRMDLYRGREGTRERGGVKEGEREPITVSCHSTLVYITIMRNISELHYIVVTGYISQDYHISIHQNVDISIHRNC